MNIYGADMPIDSKTFRGWLAFLREDPLRWIPAFTYVPLLTVGVVFTTIWWISIPTGLLSSWVIWYSWKYAYQEKLWMAAKHRAYEKHYGSKVAGNP